MNDQNLQELSNRLQLDLLVLRKIRQRFQPKDEKELIRIANDVKSLKAELGKDATDDDVISFYAKQQGIEPQQAENQSGQTTQPGQPPQATQSASGETRVAPLVAPNEQSQVPQPTQTQPTQTQPVQVQQVQTQPMQPNQLGGASVNFDAKYGQGFRFYPKDDNDLTGQCFTAGHLVSMADGTYKEIEKLVIGDNVLSSDGKTINTVVNTIKRDAETIILETSLSSFEVTPEHPFLTNNGFVEANNLSKGDKIVVPVIDKKSSGLTDNELSWLGFWLGDGDVHKESKSDSLVFRLTVSDKKLEFIESLNIGSSSHPHSSHKTTNVHVLQKKKHGKLAKLLESCFDESGQKQLPMIFNKDEYQRILDGYLKADGYEAKEKYFEFSSVSKKLMYAIQKVASILGIKVTSPKKHDRGTKKIVINGNEVRNIKDIYRAYINTKSLNNDSYAIVKLKKANGVKTVYNLTVSGDSTYICNNHAVHNCAWFSQQITRLEDGSTWTIGSSIGDKRANFNRFAQQGKAFKPGQDQIKPGQSVVFDTGTRWGHVATVAEVLPDGRVRLTESNWDNDTRVRHDRIIDPRDASVVGILKTKPTEEFRIEPPKTDPRVPTTQQTTQQGDNSAGGKQELPIKDIPVIPEDIAVGNPNAREQLKGVDQQKALELAQTNLTSLNPQPIDKIKTESIDELLKTQPTLNLQNQQQPAPQPTQGQRTGSNFEGLKDTQKNFLDKYAPSAIKIEKETGVPAKLILAQAALESNYGQSGLTRDANNFFGVKGSGPAGSTTMMTNEDYGGGMVRVPQGFRKYNSPEESFRDHARLLKENPQYYSGVMEAAKNGDYQQVSKAIGDSPYATDKQYGDKIKNIMEQNKLQNFDSKNFDVDESGALLNKAQNGADQQQDKVNSIFGSQPTENEDFIAQPKQDKIGKIADLGEIGQQTDIEKLQKGVEQGGIFSNASAKARQEITGEKTPEKRSGIGFLDVFSKKQEQPGITNKQEGVEKPEKDTNIGIFKKFAENVGSAIAPNAGDDDQFDQNVQDNSVLFTPAIQKAQEQIQEQRQRFQDPLQTIQQKTSDVAGKAAESIRQAVSSAAKPVVSAVNRAIAKPAQASGGKPSFSDVRQSQASRATIAAKPQPVKAAPAKPAMSSARPAAKAAPKMSVAKPAPKVAPKPVAKPVAKAPVRMSVAKPAPTRMSVAKPAPSRGGGSAVKAAVKSVSRAISRVFRR